MDIATLNGLDREAFVGLLGNVFEHSPWVATETFEAGPFASPDHLHLCMMTTVRQAGEDRILALLRAHPELGGQEARRGGMTAASTGEQGRLGMADLRDDEQSELEALNRRYRETFGFPCIIALRLHADRESVYAEHRRRLAGDRAGEIATCLDQIAVITRGRISGPGDADRSHAVSGLTTHVLDAVKGGGAVGIPVRLMSLGDSVATEMVAVMSDANGRAVLLPPDRVIAGRYELVFATRAYHEAQGHRPFFDDVVVRFVVTESGGAYHVPIVLAPGAYSTYRGGIPPAHDSALPPELAR